MDLNPYDSVGYSSIAAPIVLDADVKIDSTVLALLRKSDTIYPKLTSRNRADFRESVELYFLECWTGTDLPYKAPSFGFTWIWVAPEDVPEWSETCETGRGKGTHSDPTAYLVMGPPNKVPLQRSAPPFVITRERLNTFLRELPSHLEGVFRTVLVDRKGVVGASDTLGVHRSTIRRRLDLAMNILGWEIYGEKRWCSAKAS
jgi:hypothetical protein